ncbi:hypothetical protein [Streptococcus acidominimus]|uniref:Uncharacterized protein n=1 Tax=Streptococcus acidominimus TaxID=1326 RepID=A0A1Q8ECV0_STRAI|nr:hypothetical protein [Streptococcus acidominimus]OLF49622.1 hypothetical protein BU200_06355 [Streptococcus acidominimus]SUN08224.1 Uncharacterised protein [Streptococcus acidominimus]
MLDNFKNASSKIKNENVFSRAFQQPKDIFENDKLLQAEKRLQKFMESTYNGYFPFLVGLLPIMYSFFSLYGYINGYGAFSLIFAIILALIGFGVYYIGFMRLPQYKRFPLYLSAIADSKNGSLDKITNTVGFPYEIVVADIEFLIQKNILEKTYINHSKRVITSTLIGEVVSKSTATQKCSNCGATVTFLGQSTECEYCGSTVYK